MNSWLDQLDKVIRAVPVGAKVDSGTTDDWGRLSGAEKVARAERLACEAHRTGDGDLAQKWRDIAAEIKSNHQLGR